MDTTASLLIKRRPMCNLKARIKKLESEHTTLYRHVCLPKFLTTLEYRQSQAKVRGLVTAY